MSFFNFISEFFGHSEKTTLKEITMKIEELSAILFANVDVLNKAHVEIVSKLEELNAKISSLEETLANAGEVPVEVLAALDAVKVAAQSIDDVVPDAVVEVPVE